MALVLFGRFVGRFWGFLFGGFLQGGECLGFLFFPQNCCCGCLSFLWMWIFGFIFLVPSGQMPLSTASSVSQLKAV